MVRLSVNTMVMKSSTLIPGTYNSRDLGGLPATGGDVRVATIIRSDAPLNLGVPGRAALRELGVRTAIDLRQPVERRLDPPDFEDLGLDVRRLPILGEGFKRATELTMGEVYRHVLQERGANLTAVLRVLAEPDATPAIVFCSAGKDRTGLVSALILGALGVDEDAIVADYALTEQNMRGPFLEWITRRARAAGINEQELAVKVGSSPILMRESLDWLREHHGGPVGFLRHHGMTDPELAALRGRLIEPRRARAA
jgi:protein-tyrosine phosphatase